MDNMMTAEQAATYKTLRNDLRWTDAMCDAQRAILRKAEAERRPNGLTIADLHAEDDVSFPPRAELIEMSKARTQKMIALREFLHSIGRHTEANGIW